MWEVGEDGGMEGTHKRIPEISSYLVLAPAYPVKSSADLSTITQIRYPLPATTAITSSSSYRGCVRVETPSRYGVQAPSACRGTGQEIGRRGAEAKNTTLFGKLADQEDGRPVSPKNHLLGSGCQFLLQNQRGK